MYKTESRRKRRGAGVTSSIDLLDLSTLTQKPSNLSVDDGINKTTSAAVMPPPPPPPPPVRTPAATGKTSSTYNFL